MPPDPGQTSGLSEHQPCPAPKVHAHNGSQHHRHQPVPHAVHCYRCAVDRELFCLAPVPAGTLRRHPSST